MGRGMADKRRGCQQFPAQVAVDRQVRIARKRTDILGAQVAGDVDALGGYYDSGFVLTSIEVARELVGCRLVVTAGGEEVVMAIDVRSAAFEHEGRIPRRYTCEGPDVSPPLTWSGLPRSARTVAMIVDDPDAPDLLKNAMYDLWLEVDSGIGQIARAIDELAFTLETRNKERDATEAHLSRALSEKEVLLQELQHRVKNNLQLIIHSVARVAEDQVDLADFMPTTSYNIEELADELK